MQKVYDPIDDEIVNLVKESGDGITISALARRLGVGWSRVENRVIIMSQTGRALFAEDDDGRLTIFLEYAPIFSDYNPNRED